MPSIPRLERGQAPHLALDIRALRQRIGAINHTTRPRRPEKRHPSHSVSEFAIPFALVVNKTLELFADSIKLRELVVGGQNHDALWRVHRFFVILYIPNTGGTVLRCTNFAWRRVEVELIGCRVRT